MPVDHEALGRYTGGPSRMLTDDDVLRRIRPMPGKCVIELEEVPEKIGSIYLPDDARERTPRDIAVPGRCIAMTPRRGKKGREFVEEFALGDRVWVLLLLQDLNQRLICTQNTRVYARLEDAHAQAQVEN